MAQNNFPFIGIALTVAMAVGCAMYASFDARAAVNTSRVPAATPDAAAYDPLSIASLHVLNCKETAMLGSDPMTDAEKRKEQEWELSRIREIQTERRNAASGKAVLDEDKTRVIKGLGAAITPSLPHVDDYEKALESYDVSTQNALLKRMSPDGVADAAILRHDYALALKLFLVQAGNGDPYAQKQVAELYTSPAYSCVGISTTCSGVPEDRVLAFPWYRRLAAHGDADSQENLGYDYACGRGSPKDDVRAYMWLSLAAAKQASGPNASWSPKRILDKRDSFAVNMSGKDIMRAKAMTTRCLASKYRNCE